MPGGPFPFAQLEFGCLLGPPDGRYLVRSGPGDDPERVIALRTVASAPRRGRKRLRRWRRGRRLRSAPATRAPLVRITVIGAEPLAGEGAAKEWLEGLRGEPEALRAEIADGLRQVNRMLRAHRAGTSDPYVREVSERQALTRRVGYGGGAAVAEGRYTAAVEVPPSGERRAKRAERLAPEERLAAVLGGREAVLACEELVLRARLDIDASRYREAALQARVALEAMLAEMGTGAIAEVEGRRPAVVEAANRALDGDLEVGQREAVAQAVEAMRAALAHTRGAPAPRRGREGRARP